MFLGPPLMPKQTPLLEPSIEMGFLLAHSPVSTLYSCINITTKNGKDAVNELAHCLMPAASDLPFHVLWALTLLTEMNSSEL